jgi:hypothetical protein
MHRRASILLLLLLAVSASAQTIRVTGFVTADGVYANGPQSWLDGGWGRLDASRDGVMADAQLGVDWVPANWLNVHVAGDARRDVGDRQHGGLVEAYADVHHAFGANQLRLRAGQFFLPTSRENTGELWSSQYAITFSAINSWIAHEVRPVGAELEYRHEFPSLNAVTVAGTAFRNNDTMGTLLAWSGWSISNRLTTYNEVLPLPPLFSLNTAFVKQRRDGTVPFERDLDGRTGYAARVRYTIPERFVIQYAHLDNEADRLLWRGEYAWHTKFDLVSAQLGNQDSTTLAGEWMNGSTGMGIEPRPYVDAGLHSWYALVSRKYRKSRFTVRYDEFGMQNRDDSPTETNTEHGRAWTLAWLYELTPHWRLGSEFTNVTGDKVIAAESGFDPNTDARTFIVEVRYGF